jgi:DNA-binding NarL/FixJ family response regulator
MKPLRILLADDHPLSRAGVRTLVEPLPGVEVVAEAADGREALEQIETSRANLVMLDIAMPGMNGLEVLLRITEDHPGVKVIMLSAYANEEYVIRALRAGAAGYLLKNATRQEFKSALDTVREGDTHLSPEIAGRVAEYLRRNGEEPDPLAQLTRRQREVLQLVAEGLPNKAIADRLDLSVKTIEMHRTEMMRRLGIHDVAGLVRYAMRAGIVMPDQ